MQYYKLYNPLVKCDNFDTPLGIVSATPAIVGDSGELHWQGKYITDDFGRVQYHDVVVPAEYDEEGNLLIEEHIESQPVLNPEWNPETKYIPRKDRPEWSTVGVIGKLVVLSRSRTCRRESRKSYPRSCSYTAMPELRKNARSVPRTKD